MLGLMEKVWNIIVDYPKSWDDYVEVGRWMIYKKLLVILCALLSLALAAAIIIIVLPPSKPTDGPEPITIPVFYYLDDMLRLHTGEVILVDEQQRVIYRGAVESGLRSGWGKSFTQPDEILQYEGEFRQNSRGGWGRLFDRDGALLYQGDFLNDLYDGNGILYRNGGELYEGGFSNGLPHGEGVEYDDKGNLRYSGGFVRGKRDGKGLETDAEGFPTYDGEFRQGLYDGHGVLYTSGGARLKFEGIFILGKPAREGKIYNLRGQLLYEGAVYEGKVDCLYLLGQDFGLWQSYIKERPIIYFANGYAGYIYSELGIAAITRYNDGPIVADFELLENGEEPDSSQFPSNDGMPIHTMLLDGGQYYDQLPPDGGVEAHWEKLDGFQAFLASRLAAVQNPAAKLRFEVQTRQWGDGLYEALDLPREVDFDGQGFYSNRIYYMWGGYEHHKGGIPQVIHCRETKLEG